MKRTLHRVCAAVLSLYLYAFPALGAEMLIPVGEVIGLELASGSVTVAAYDDALPISQQAGLRIGDEIVAIDGKKITCADDVREALGRSDGRVDLTVRREKKELTLRLEPAITPEGPKLGVYLRQGITGIGTVTFYDPETGLFGTLGHGVSDGEGALLGMTRGSAYPAQVVSVRRGKAGTPGQLRGALDGESALGALKKNTPQGVFGTAPDRWTGTALPVAEFSEVHTGAAHIRSTIGGSGVQEYSVEILKIYPKERSDGRNFLIRVTDPALLDATGGIVQGMSGSPIIQNGKLIGAVTHVLVNDPTTGYGIFIENMLDAAA